MTKYQDIAMMLEANAITNTVDAYDLGKADAIDECIAEINKQFKDGYGFGVTVYPHTICNILEMLKERNNEAAE